MTIEMKEEMNQLMDKIGYNIEAFTDDQSRKRYALHQEIGRLKKVQAELLEENKAIRNHQVKPISWDRNPYDDKEAMKVLLRGKPMDYWLKLENDKEELLHLLGDKRKELHTAWDRLQLLEKENRALEKRVYDKEEQESVCYVCGRPKKKGWRK